MKKFGTGWGLLALLGVGAIGWGAWKRAEDAKAAAREKAARENVHELVRGAIGRLATAFGVQAPPVALDDAVPNAQSDGRTIAVNAVWFGKLLDSLCADRACNVAVAHGVLGHEMAHHVYGDALVPSWIRNRHDQELRADFFAGRAMAIFGDDVGAIERVLIAVSSANASHTHPSLQDRLRAARAGFGTWTEDVTDYG